MPAIVYRRQREILDLISLSIDKYGYAPTLTEIADRLGLSSLATVHEHLAVLEKKGLIRRYRGRFGELRFWKVKKKREPEMVKLNCRYWVLLPAERHWNHIQIQMRP